MVDDLVFPAFAQTPTPVIPTGANDATPGTASHALIERLSFDPLIRFDPTDPVETDQHTDLVEPAGYEPISFESTLLRRDALASTLDDGPLFEPFETGASVTRPIRLGFQRETSLIDGDSGPRPRRTIRAQTTPPPGANGSTATTSRSNGRRSASRIRCNGS